LTRCLPKREKGDKRKKEKIKEGDVNCAVRKRGAKQGEVRKGHDTYELGEKENTVK